SSGPCAYVSMSGSRTLGISPVLEFRLFIVSDASKLRYSVIRFSERSVPIACVKSRPRNVLLLANGLSQYTSGCPPELLVRGCEVYQNPCSVSSSFSRSSELPRWYTLP